MTEERDQYIVAMTERTASRRIVGYTAHMLLNPLHRILFYFESMWGAIQSGPSPPSQAISDDAAELQGALVVVRRLVDDLFLFDRAKGDSVDSVAEPLHLAQFLQAFLPQQAPNPDLITAVEVSNLLPRVVCLPREYGVV